MRTTHYCPTLTGSRATPSSNKAASSRVAATRALSTGRDSMSAQRRRTAAALARTRQRRIPRAPTAERAPAPTARSRPLAAAPIWTSHALTTPAPIAKPPRRHRPVRRRRRRHLRIRSLSQGRTVAVAKAERLPKVAVTSGAERRGRRRTRGVPKFLFVVLKNAACATFHTFSTASGSHAQRSFGTKLSRSS